MITKVAIASDHKGYALKEYIVNTFDKQMTVMDLEQTARKVVTFQILHLKCASLFLKMMTLGGY